MASSATTKAARQAVRAAAVSAQDQLARRTRLNVEDLAAFFSAQQRGDAVDDCLKDRVGVLEAQAAERRGEQRRQCGAALRSMRDRGESLREIARMAGVGAKTVRELIRLAGRLSPAGAVTGVVTAAPVNGHDGQTAPPEAVALSEPVAADSPV
jgi:hypothetical protein